MTLDNQELLLLIGRPNRKLRGFVPEIREWLSQGISVRGMHRLLQLKGETADYQAVYREVQNIKKTTKPATRERIKEVIPLENLSPKLVLNPNAFDEVVAAGAGNPLFRRQRERQAAALQAKSEENP
jgi:hypothetical protein